jgi:hypothetical protein
MDRDRMIQQQTNLKQNQGKSPEEIAELVDRKIQEEELLTAFIGLSDTEKIKAIQLYNQYVTEHSFESLAEKSTLINLVYLEILNDRVKLFIEQEGNEKKGAIPLKMTEQLVANTTQIMELKEKLGMMRDAESESALDLFNEVKEKCLRYYEEHAAEFQNKCPHCQQTFPSILPPDKLESCSSSWFKNTTLYNYDVFDAYHKKEITIDRAAKILGVHKNYIEKMYNEIYLKEKDDSQS